MRPTARLLWLLAGLIAIGLAAIFQPLAATVWWSAVAALALLSLLDSALLATAAAPVMERTLPHIWPLGVWQTVELSLHNRRKSALTLTVTEGLPVDVDSEGLPVTLTLPAARRVLIRYRARGLGRGVRRISHVDTLFHGPLGLLEQRRLLPLASEVRIYPHYADVARYTLLATDNRLSRLGIRKRPRRGEGLEFHQLREYRQGDAPRQIDWKATSRLRKLISREYQDERDQQVILLLDTGFRMRSQDAELPHFDHVLNAALLLAQTVTRQGDAVGLMTFAGAERWTPPAKGHVGVNRLLELVFDLEPAWETPDFLRAAAELSQRERKRSLVVILTNLREEDGDDLKEACALLGRRHLVLVATLREQLFERLGENRLMSVDDALTAAAAEDYLAQRQRQLGRLAKSGVQLLDTAPDQLAIRLVNRYLDIKAGGRL